MMLGCSGRVMLLGEVPFFKDPYSCTRKKKYVSF